MKWVEIIVTSLSVISAILGGVWWIVNRVFSKGMDKQHFIEFERGVNDSFDKIDTKLESLEKTTNNHTYALIELYSFLGQKYPQDNFLFSAKNSPKVLNKLGEDIYKEINGKEFLEKNRNTLFEYVDKDNPKTRFDVETSALKALSLYSGDDAFNSLKDYIYDRAAIELPGGKTYEIGLGDICFILSIPLRDMYIKERNIE